MLQTEYHLPENTVYDLLLYHSDLQPDGSDYPTTGFRFQMKSRRIANKNVITKNGHPYFTPGIENDILSSPNESPSPRQKRFEASSHLVD